MSNGIETNNVVHFRRSDSVELQGNIIRLSRYEVAFELYHAIGAIQVSEALSEFSITLKDRLVYSGRAVINGLVNTGTTMMCEATLSDSWQDIDFNAGWTQKAKLEEEFSGFFREWHKTYRVSPEYKIIIADMHSFLMDLRLWFEQLELGVRASPSGDRLELQIEVVQQVEQPILDAINDFFRRFEEVAGRIEAEALPAHRNYMKRHLHPLVLCSPFAYRTFQKPLGYAGDYEMVAMMLRNPYEGSSLFAKVLNLWFIKQPPAEAHRNRIDRLVERLQQECLRGLETKEPIRIMNVGCGPAVEVQRFLTDHSLSEQARFTLMDFNEETLQHATGALNEAKSKAGRSTPIQFVRKSVQQLLKEAGRTIEGPRSTQYDFIYCAGLFDYLSEQICQRLMSLMYGWLAPGGLLLATNVAPGNPLRNGMEHLLDWHLIYRGINEAERLIPPLAVPGTWTVRSDITGVNLFVEVRKPKNG